MGSAAQRSNRLNMRGEIKVTLYAQLAAELGASNCLLSTASGRWRDMRSAWTDAAAYARSDVDFAFLSTAQRIERNVHGAGAGGESESRSSPLPARDQ